MVPAQELLVYVRTEPFRPFRIRMNSGRTFDIRHPEMIKIGRDSFIIFSFVSEDQGIYDRWDTVSLVLIEAVSHVDLPAAQEVADSNGG